MLLAKELVTLYEDGAGVLGGRGRKAQLVGCGGLHVLWEDLAKIRRWRCSRARSGSASGTPWSSALVAGARQLGLRRVFVLTFEKKCSRGSGSPRSTEPR